MSSAPMTVVETPPFLRDVKANIDEEERRECIDCLASHPQSGVVIPETVESANCVGFAQEKAREADTVSSITFILNESISSCLPCMEKKKNPTRRKLKATLCEN
ncbi:MAG: hypothetical protein IJU37_01985 [Desulfovibrio sp.]|nr:hypothetical protein [Desulfovibrio sp.]